MIIALVVAAIWITAACYIVYNHVNSSVERAVWALSLDMMRDARLEEISFWETLVQEIEDKIEAELLPKIELVHKKKQQLERELANHGSTHAEQEEKEM